MDVVFTDEGKYNCHVRGDMNCRECVRYAENAGEPCKCGGTFHAEYDYEDCTEDYSDCYDVYNYRCDKCGSTSLETLA